MWKFWLGYVIIQIEGFCAARFLKRITDAGIRTSNARRVNDTTVRLTIPAKRFFMLRKLRKGLPVRVRIVERGGLPFRIQKLLSRPVLWIGTGVLFIAIYLLSTRIWVIRIDESKRIDPDEIRSLLSERGIRPGAAVHGPVLITAANDLSAQIRDAAWIGLDREGVMLRVHIKESLPETTKRAERVPSDIVASKDGVVTSVSVMRGQSAVKAGDRVKKGDVLISGTVVYKDNRYETSADGEIRAAVVYRAEAEVSDCVTESFETGAAETVRIVRFAGVEIVRSKPSFEHYRLIGTSTVSVSGLLPVSFAEYTAYEIGFRSRPLSDEEADRNALVLVRERAYGLVPQDAAIINTYGTVKTEKDRRLAIVIVTAEEIIGKTEEIPHDR